MVSYLGRGGRGQINNNIYILGAGLEMTHHQTLTPRQFKTQPPLTCVKFAGEIDRMGRRKHRGEGNGPGELVLCGGG